ncbi:DsbA family oxidoreductase [Deinococcus sp. KNUC1210]|uniref:DsbA family oxidoreductase n=1 Tax=Deinococcus sp. KNUC1210 TaxID=2917691 RepID=UPI001EF0F6E7|nr:DsbA family oxidoreductase [Deinococcus sp. KNUC1210]ULH14580.1 DsbA family oxidoreductase [Deinococcus sp. KNUC1210]
MTTAPSARLQVDIWSDIACPWCYVGKRRFEQALAKFPQRGEVDVVWHSFELDPAAQSHASLNMRDILAKKYGRSQEQAQQMLDSMTQTADAEGLTYHFDRLQVANTFQAHQLLHLAAEHGRQAALKERLLHAHFSEGLNVDDPETLITLAAEVGLDSALIRRALEQQTYAEAVRQDEAQAQRYGIQGVPFFVLDGTYGVSGAQSPETLLNALQQTWSERHPLQLIGVGSDSSAAGLCDDGSCTVPAPRDQN